MDSLTIQDAFEPYYAGRDRVAASRDQRGPARPENGSAKEQARGALPANIELSDNEPDSKTEH